MKITLSIPHYGQIDSGLPVPTGGIDDTAKIAIVTFVDLIVIIAIVFALWQLLTGGMSVMISRGNKEVYMRAWRKVTFAALGLAIIIFIFIAMNMLGGLIGVSLLPFFSG